ncbi:11825_t:CDS:2 [Ambispora gerdemannii]|uniref:DNA-directed RNA polymerases I and III subunit RPAC1 n=1 Tax=Ambispora gerdemannii TaxID=144530 RepID=A0A9N8V9J2_9GLOM|nr:11825_t:CDS:2 [Ambispora gerdemannii]
MAALPQKQANDDALNLLRGRVIIESDHVKSVSSMEFPGLSARMDTNWNFDSFKEVPTMAIETVYVHNNTSIIVDEVLAHRLGLIPIKVDPENFDFRSKNPDDPPTDRDTIVFVLNIECKENPTANSNERDPNKRFINSNVHSSDLKWAPQGDQGVRYENNPIKPVHDDILLAKLRPGQAHCAKGIGKEHAKWSPVATASYRLLPEIILKKEIKGDLAYKFVSCFPEGVAEVIEKENGEKVAKVVNPRKDTVSREVLRHKEFQDIVQLTRVRDHFIFNIESTGILPPEILFQRSIGILIQKCAIVKEALRRRLKVLEEEEVNSGGGANNMETD